MFKALYTYIKKKKVARIQKKAPEGRWRRRRRKKMNQYLLVLANKFENLHLDVENVDSYILFYAFSIKKTSVYEGKYATGTWILNAMDTWRPPYGLIHAG